MSFFYDNNGVIKERDYAESLKINFDMEIYSEAFGFNHNLFIEGSTCGYYDKDHNDVSNEVNVNMYFIHIFRWLWLECSY